MDETAASLRIIISRLLVSHSQIVITRQPASTNSILTCWSRVTLVSNLPCQKSVRDLGVDAFEQPGCRCQKQPCTNIATRCFGKTRSGRPGRFLRCRRKRRPSAWAARRTRISGKVSLLRTRDISQERRSDVRRSTSELLRRQIEVVSQTTDRLGGR